MSRRFGNVELAEAERSLLVHLGVAVCNLEAAAVLGSTHGVPGVEVRTYEIIASVRALMSSLTDESESGGLR